MRKQRITPGEHIIRLIAFFGLHGPLTEADQEHLRDWANGSPKHYKYFIDDAKGKHRHKLSKADWKKARLRIFGHTGSIYKGNIAYRSLMELVSFFRGKYRRMMHTMKEVERAKAFLKGAPYQSVISFEELEQAVNDRQFDE